LFESVHYEPTLKLSTIADHEWRLSIIMKDKYHGYTSAPQFKPQADIGFLHFRPEADIPGSLKGLIVLITKKSIILRVHY